MTERRNKVLESPIVSCQRSPGAILVACHTWFHEQHSGSSKIATEIAEHLADHGHPVFYICSTRDPTFNNPTVISGVQLWRYPQPVAKSPRLGNLLHHFVKTYQLTRAVLRRTSVVCVSGHTPLQALGAFVASRGRCDRRVYSVHSPFVEELACGWNGGTLRVRQRAALLTARLIERENCRRSNVIQCDSAFTADVMKNQYPSVTAGRVAVSPGWVDLDRFRPFDNTSACRNVLGPEWQTDLPVFLTVRRLEPRMGMDALIDAAGLLSQTGFRFRLIIGGTGSLAGSLQRQISEMQLTESVRLIGRIPEDVLPKCFAAADCFVLPTRSLECFGLIILEAYACGVPVIGTPVGAIPELIEKHGDAWLTAGAAGHDIADRMAKFLRKELVADRACLRRIAEQWSATSGLERLSNLLLPVTSQT